MSATLYARVMVLFFVLTGLLMLLGYAVGLYFGNPAAFVLGGLLMAIIINFASYYWSDSLVVRMSGARLISESENPTLYGIVRKVSQEAGIPTPRVGVVDSPQPNAFATGRGPNKAVVVATSGILSTLNQDELEAVIGHEIGHVVHRDILISAIAATIAGVISYIGQIALWSTMSGGGSDRRNGGGSALTLLLAAIFVPLGAVFIRMGISRSFEYNADEYGAKLTRKPGALATALQKISSRARNPGLYGRSSLPASTSPSTASLWIVNPFKGQTLFELMSTHPSEEKRIGRLRRIGEEMGVYVP